MTRKKKYKKKQNICPKCNALVGRYSEICKHCGYKLIKRCPICGGYLSHIKQHFCKELKRIVSKEEIEEREKAKKKREKVGREKREEKMEKEKEDYNKIPNLEDLIKSYVYQQLKVLQKDLKTIQLEELDNEVKKQLNSKMDMFIDYLKLEISSLTPYQKELLKEDCFKVSEPIINELKPLIRNHVEKERIRKKREEQERKLKEKVKMTKELFGKEIIKKEDIEKVEKYKTIDEQIDELLIRYSDWEKKRRFKN